MFSEFSRTLEMSRARFKGFLDYEKKEFVHMPGGVVESIPMNGSESRTLDGQYLTLVDGLLKLIYLGDVDEILRQGAARPVAFLAEREASRKGDVLIKDLLAFLSSIRGQNSERTFSEHVLIYLKSCSLEEFRHLTVQRLAGHFKYHPNYFGQKFAKEQGYSPHRAILHEKLNRALLLLKDKDHASVKIIASNLGFSSRIYFSRLFKSRYGIRPTKVQTLFDTVPNPAA